MQQPSVRLMEYSFIQREAHLALLPSAPGSSPQRQAHCGNSLSSARLMEAPLSSARLIPQRQAHCGNSFSSARLMEVPFSSARLKVEESFQREAQPH